MLVSGRVEWKLRLNLLFESCKKQVSPRDPGSPKLRMGFMEPKYYALRFGDLTPFAHHLRIWQLMPIGIFKVCWAFHNSFARWNCESWVGHDLRGSPKKTAFCRVDRNASLVGNRGLQPAFQKMGGISPKIGWGGWTTHHLHLSWKGASNDGKSDLWNF